MVLLSSILGQAGLGCRQCGGAGRQGCAPVLHERGEDEEDKKERKLSKVLKLIVEIESILVITSNKISLY